MLTFHCCLTHSCHQGPQEGRRAHLRFIKVCLGGGEQRRSRSTICQFHLISGNTFNKKKNMLVASCLYSGYVSGSGCCLPELWSSKEMLSLLQQDNSLQQLPFAQCRIFGCSHLPQCSATVAGGHSGRV